MARPRKQKRKTGRRVVSFAIFLIAAGLVYCGRHELLWGVQGYVLHRIDFARIESQADLPPSAEAPVWPAEVVGIPDYKNSVRFPHEGEILTCFRMVDFGNRVVVCSVKGLKRPEAIDEIIKERAIRGRLERLSRSPLEERLRKEFRGLGAGIRLPNDAFLLSENKSPLPSVVTLGILSLCLIICCLSAYRLIQG